MGWPGPVGKELQCVTQRLAGGDPLCDATMRAVRDGLVWVGGCDETDQRKDTIVESSHMQLQDSRRGRARMNPATCPATEARSRGRRPEQRRVEFLVEEGSQQLALVYLLELATLHWPSGATIP